jgi:hypothetical protein
MEPVSPPRRRVPEHHPASPAGAGIVRGRRRRRPAGEPPPLPRRLGMTGWWWLVLGTIAIIASTIAAGGLGLPLPGGGGMLPSVDRRVLEGLAGLRTPALTRAMVVLAGLSAQWVIAALGWATILVLLAARRFRHLLVFLGVALLIHAITANLAYNSLDQVSALRPPGIAMLGPAGLSAYPVLSLATLTGRLVSMLYCLVPQGRRRQQGKAVVAGIIALVALARLYLAIDTPTTVVVAIVIGVMIPLVAFRLLCPDEVFPVTYRRGRTAHLDVGGRRGEAIRRALHDQLGVIVEDVQPFGWEGVGRLDPAAYQGQGGGGRLAVRQAVCQESSAGRPLVQVRPDPAVWAVGGRKAVQHRAAVRPARGLRPGADATRRGAQPRALWCRGADPGA